MRPMIPLSGLPILTVSSPPHVHCGRGVKTLMRDTLLALVPAFVSAVAVFGVGALRVTFLAAATAVAVEAACARLMEREPEIDDLHALLTGVLFAFLLPASAPWWLAVAGSGASIVLGKMIFGGLGGSPLCAPLVGWAVCRLSWPAVMNPDISMLAFEQTSPLSLLKHFGVEAVADVSLSSMLMGGQLGGLGATQVLWLVLGGLFLVARGHVHPAVPLSMLGGAFALAALYRLGGDGAHAGPFFHLAGGSLAFGAFFLATDCSSSPSRLPGMILFGALAGGMTIVIRVHGVYPDGAPFAILLANLFAPVLDRLRPGPFGGARPFGAR